MTYAKPLAYSIGRSPRGFEVVVYEQTKKGQWDSREMIGPFETATESHAMACIMGCQTLLLSRGLDCVTGRAYHVPVLPAAGTQKEDKR